MAAETGADQAKVTLYWLNISRAQSFVWLFEECKGLDWKLETFKRGSDMLAPKTLKEIHPLGKSPLIKVEIPNREPLIIAESGTIMEYICDYYAPHLVPKRYMQGKEGQIGGETESWLRYRHIMHYSEGSLMTVLLISLFMDQIRNAPVPFFLKPIVRAIPTRVESMFLNNEFKTHWSFLESQLATSPDGGKYICGKDLTAADILLSFALFVASHGKSKIDPALYPKLTAYTKMLEESDGYVRSIKKVEEITGEPFKAML